jgi:hypothetical protein
MSEDSGKKLEMNRAPQVPKELEPLAFAIRDANVKRIYANGFSLGMSNADTHIVLQWFGQPVAIVNLSYTLAKTLSLKLSALMHDWEEKTKQPLATTDTIDQAFADKK